MNEFSIPSGEPEQLWTDEDLAFRCETFADLSESSQDEVGEIAESECRSGGQLNNRQLQLSNPLI